MLFVICVIQIQWIWKKLINYLRRLSKHKIMRLSRHKMKLNGQVRIHRNSCKQSEIDLGICESSRLSYKGQQHIMSPSSMKIKQCYDLAYSFRALNLGCIRAQNYKILRAEEAIKKKQRMCSDNKKKKKSEGQYFEFLQEKRKLKRMLLLKGEEKKAKVLSEILNKDTNQINMQKQSSKTKQSLQKFNLNQNLRSYHLKENIADQIRPKFSESSLKIESDKPGRRWMGYNKIFVSNNHSNISESKNLNKDFLKKLFTGQDSSLSQYRFSETKVYPFQNPAQPSNQTISSQFQSFQKKLIKAIYEGNYFGVEIQLSLCPELICTKERRTKNNLLHLCVLNNNEDLFQMILRKSIQARQHLLSAVNKYGRTPVQLGRLISFFKKKSLVALLADIEDKIARGLIKKVLHVD